MPRFITSSFWRFFPETGSAHPVASSTGGVNTAADQEKVMQSVSSTDATANTMSRWVMLEQR